MADVFISYARSTEAQARRIGVALQALGYSVWRDDELPAHRAYSEVIEDRLAAAKAVVVVWSAEATKSHWVRAEADAARAAGTLVQLSLDGAVPPMPFNQIQCADMAGWNGEQAAPGWRKVIASVAELVGGGSPAAPSPASPPPAPSLPDKPSIAVMAFAHSDPEQDLFAEGVVEEIVGALSRYKSLFVIGAGSGLAFKGADTQEAARRLGVRYILDGSVRKSGERVRIAVKLTDARDGTQVWSQRFDDTLEDVFALQDRVALAVAGVIEPAVQAVEGRRAFARPTSDMTSYEFYLRGWRLAWNLDRLDANAALDLFNQAIERDPNHARALAGTAACHGLLYTFFWSDDVEHDRVRGLELSHRALKLAEDDPEVLAWSAFVLFCMNDDLQAGAALVDRALSLNPSLAFGWMVSGHVRSRLGEGDRAAAHFETALRLDPLSALRHWALSGLGIARMMQARLDEAVALFRESAQLRAGSPANYAFMAACLGHMGQIAAAREAIARFEAAAGLPVERWARWIGGIDFVLSGIALARRTAS
jgi:adenylate cyclase